MKTNMDIWAGAGVVALDQDELLKVRGGFAWGPFVWNAAKAWKAVGTVAAGVVAGLIVTVLENWDEFKEGFKEGFEAAME